MKSIFAKLFVGISCMIAITSCLGNSDNSDNGLNVENLRIALQNMQGTYSGKMKWICDRDSGTVNNINWKVGSLITVKNFPVSILAKGASSIAPSIKTALENTSTTAEVKCYMQFYVLNSSAYGFRTVSPELKFSFSDGGRTYNAVVQFAIQTLSCVFLPANRRMGYFFVANSMMIDNTTTTFTPVYFYIEN